MPTYAIRVVDEDRLAEVKDAVDQAMIEAEFPGPTYDCWDQTSKPMPNATELEILPYTVDTEMGEIVCKLDSAAEAAMRLEAKLAFQRELIPLMTAKDKADSLGADYADFASELSSKILGLEAKVNEIK